MNNKTPPSKGFMPKDYTKDEDGVVIRKPDVSLKKKLGHGNKSLKALLTTAAVENAEKAMAASSPEMLDEIKKSLDELEAIVNSLRADKIAPLELKAIIEKGFEIKAKAGFCNFPLASSFARFMYLYAEGLMECELTAKDINLIGCCVNILSVIFERDYVGDGDNESLADFWDNEDARSPFDI